MSSGREIIDGLRDAVAGNLSRVLIYGQTWVRRDGPAEKRIAELEDALRLVMIGGNHVALLIGADHPPADASHEAARKHYAGQQDAYEAWCCWQTIMMARDVLGQ
jgi:hypothetical protein